MRETLAVSERRACRVLGQVRRTQRYTLKVTDDETILTESIVSLASEYGRYGYRRITALLRRDGWRVNHKRGRLWFNDGSCMEFIARAVRSWLSRLGVQTLFIERGSPWENGYVESFNGKLRDELLNGESVDHLAETAVQSGPTPQRVRLSTTRTGGHQSAHRGRILTLDVDT